MADQDHAGRLAWRGPLLKRAAGQLLSFCLHHSTC